MKRFGTKVLAVVLTSSMLVMPVYAKPSVSDLKKDKKKVEKQVESLQDELATVLNKIDKLENELILKGEEVIQATDDLDEAKIQEKEQYEAMKLRIKYMYEEGDSSLIEALVTSESFTDLVNNAEYVQSVHNYDREKLQEYVETKEKIAKLKKKLEKEQEEMQALQEDYEKQEASLNATIEEKKDEIEDFDEQIQEAVRKAEEERRRQAEEAARQEQQNQQNQGGASTPSTDGGSTSNTYTGTGDTSVAQAIVNAAYSQLGVPYVWGGTTPGSALDCSGLTQYCHRVAGISIPRTSGPQGAGGKSVSSPRPGDIVCYPGHVGIYIGGGKMIHAPHTGDIVRVASVYGSPWYRRYW